MIEIYNSLCEALFSIKAIFRITLPVLLISMVSACSGLGEKHQQDNDLANNDKNAKIEKAKVIDEAVLSEYQRAIDYLDKGNLPEANKLLTNIVEKHPDLAAPLYNLGQISEEQNDQKTAEYYYTQALEVDSQYYLALNNLGVIARSKGNFKQASEYYSKGLNVAPDSPELHYNFAVLNEIYLHDYTKAIKHYERYLALVDSSDLTDKDKNVKSWIKDLKRRNR